MKGLCGQNGKPAEMSFWPQLQKYVTYWKYFLALDGLHRHENDLSCQNLKMMKKPEKVGEIVQNHPKTG